MIYIILVSIVLIVLLAICKAERCEHEVDMDYMEYPRCIHCKKELPRTRITNSGWELHPLTESWHLKKCIDNLYKKKLDNL